MIDANTGPVSDTLQAAASRLPADIDRGLFQAGLLLQAQIQRNASGRPGPNVITGNYRRSWSTQRVPGVGVTVGTNAPQGPRLEFGFVGTDSLGRRYNQPPFPHMQPAITTVQDQIDRLLGDIVDRALA